jgi:hypothetical protein
MLQESCPFFLSGKLNILDVGLCHIYTCPKPWLIVGQKPMSFNGQSQVLAVNDAESHPNKLESSILRFLIELHCIKFNVKTKVPNCL